MTEPLVSAIPPGTKLRALFVTEGGDAYVDLSREVTAAHTGGTLDETLTIYTIVNALTANLPAITSVKLLVAGAGRRDPIGYRPPCLPRATAPR